MPVIEVQCYAGYRADERPRSFILNERTHIIEHIIDRWRSPEFEFFKVAADDGKVYLLKHDMRQHAWACENVQKKGQSVTSPAY
jgi:hypothetical protein